MRTVVLGLAGWLLSAALAGCVLPESRLVGQGGNGAAPSAGDGGTDAEPSRGGAGGPGGRAGVAGRSGKDAASGGNGGAGAQGGRVGAAGVSGKDAADGARGGAGANGGAPAAESGGSGADVCASSVCNADYPCQKLSSGGYTCRGQFADWSPAYSASAFKDNGDGTVTDSRNGLVWQRSVPSSYAPACSGKHESSSPMGDACTWEDAKKYCAGLSLAGAGWRLPAAAGLESLVDDTRTDPAIDLTAFPATPSNVFWSSSPFVGSSGNAWYVSFSSGYSGSDATGISYRVRCVR